jgi:phosphotriesterase-related protein
VSVDLIARLLPEFPDGVVVGMDAAKPAYWRSHGGGPGLAWLVRELPALLRSAGVSEDLIDRLYIRNPAAAFSFAAANTPV